jgi:hypothetical protein
MREGCGDDFLAIAWLYPGQELEVIPALHSRTVKPGWPATCANDSDCDDGVWCNGKLHYYHQCPFFTPQGGVQTNVKDKCRVSQSGEEICSDNVCEFGRRVFCSDGLLCTDDICNESTRSCEYPTTDCLSLDDPCATDQCIETLGGCQFTCGAILETWTGIVGFDVADLVTGTNNFADDPSRTERLGSLLEAPYTINEIDYGSRMKGWLILPVTGNYVFWIASDDAGEHWLSSDDNPDNKILRCYQLWATCEWDKYTEQKSTSIALVADEAYYFEVTP